MIAVGPAMNCLLSAAMRRRPEVGADSFGACGVRAARQERVGGCAHAVSCRIYSPRGPPRDPVRRPLFPSPSEKTLTRWARACGWALRSVLDSHLAVRYLQSDEQTP